MSEPETYENQDNSLIPIHPVKEIFLHKSIDLDGGIAAAILQILGEELFPKIKEAKISFHGKLPMSLKEMKENEVIALDFGWSDLTEEEKQDSEVKYYVIDHHNLYTDKSTTMLVAELLGITDSPIWRRLIEYVTMHDLEGNAIVTQELMRNGEVTQGTIRKSFLLAEFNLAGVLSVLGNGDAKTYETIRRYVKHYYKAQTYFYEKVPEEFRKKAEIRFIAAGGRLVKIAIINSDMPKIAAYARTQEGGRCDIVIQNKNGNIFIQTNQWSENPYDLMEVAKFIQVWEMKKRENSSVYTKKDLEDGILCNNWHLAKTPAGFVWGVLNASEKRDIEPTLLSVDEIITAIRWGLNEGKFSRQCPRSYCLGRDCGFFAFFLNRCKKIRDYQ